MNASRPSQGNSVPSQTTEPRISALTSTPNDPATLVLITDPSLPSTTSAGFGSLIHPNTSNIATDTARPTPSFGPGFFATAQDPSKHLASQLPLETPFFTPQAPWTESSRSDYFSSAASTPAPHTMTSHIVSPTGIYPSSQANIFSSGFSLPAQTPAAIEISTAPPAELNLQVMSCDTVSRLLEQVLQAIGEKGHGGDKNAVMLLDMRPSVSHAASSIMTAVNVCIPNMLLKRPMYQLKNVAEQLTTDEDIETFTRWSQFANIVLFDASGAAPVVGSPTFFMVQKFRKEGCNATLAYLQGGYSEFLATSSGLCRTDAKGSTTERMSLNLSSSAPTPTSTNPISIVSPQRQRLHLGSLPSLMTQPPGGPLGCQTPMIENPNVNPLFESVRQAMGLSTNITEEIPVRLPMGFTVQTMQEYLPNWLLTAISDGTGKARLSEYFQKVEINENKRLALLMLPQNMRSGRTSNFSIGAGIEQGLKNRYNNIWPYDHTRVKIGEVEQGEDDYINASFLTPTLSKKSYIATQGPLPSTFQDFWKATWEQSSRVVVMLTREQEMGRIKCHEYWPTAQQPIMNVGAMQVTFVSEFLPDPTIGTILVRQLKLQHVHRPESEPRNITQIQYTGWPDFGVPETPLEVLRVIQLANDYNTPLSLAGPMIVHCSAGCGRTGAFCVIDSILTELKENPGAIMQSPGGQVTPTPRLSLSSKPSLEFSRSGNDRVVNATGNASSGTGASRPHLQQGSQQPSSAPAASDDLLSDIVYTSVSNFREQRISMVQTLRQYVFCYEAIFWHLAMEFAKERPNLGLMVVPPPSLAVHTPLLPMPPQSQDMASNPTLSMGNAPISTTKEEFSFFG
ncbi:hypothetical protein BGX27_008500 [Mortierella sp. AM989]|nr:hypothetical protein BGX27_008500 [Mortierella sp. AM989]